MRGCGQPLNTTQIGMSMHPSSRFAFGLSTNNDVSGHYKRHYFLFSFLFFFFFSVVYFSHRRSARIKKLIKRKLLKTSKNLVENTFPGSVSHFGFSRRCGVAGGERVPPAPLGWYLFESSRTHLLGLPSPIIRYQLCG